MKKVFVGCLGAALLAAGQMISAASGGSAVVSAAENAAEKQSTQIVLRLKDGLTDEWDYYMDDYRKRPRVSVDDFEVVSHIEGTTVEKEVYQIISPDNIIYRTTEVAFASAGTYKVVYRATDNQGNYNDIERTIEVKDLMLPVLEIEQEIYVRVNASVSLYPLKVYDFYSGDNVVTELTIYDGSGNRAGYGFNFTPKTAGRYTLEYTCTDENGNSVSKQAYLIAEEASRWTAAEPGKKDSEPPAIAASIGGTGTVTAVLAGMLVAVHRKQRGAKGK